MSQQPSTGGDESTDDTTAADPRLQQFRRNLFFHGKLMTARDMEAEQQYHARRLETLAGSVLGEGVVTGLGASVETDEETVVATVESGVGIDGAGRPIVVEPDARGTIPTDQVPGPDDPETGVSVFARFEPCSTEKVPIAGSEDACGQDCTYNRVLETVAVDVEPGETRDHAPVPEIDWPEEVSGDDATPEQLQAIAESFIDARDRAETDAAEGTDDGRVFLGHFTESENGWSPTDSIPTERVYGNDMLYAAIARHATDFENPHDVVAAIGADGTPIEPDEGSVEVVPGDGIAVEAAPDEHELGIGLDAGLLEELVHDLLEGLVGPIDDDDWERVRSALESINGVEGDESGGIELVSQTETISFEEDEQDSAISIDLDPETAGLHEVEERLASIEDRLDDLESDGTDVEEIDLGPYVRDEFETIDFTDYLDDYQQIRTQVDRIDPIVADIEDLTAEIPDIDGRVTGLEQNFETIEQDFTGLEQNFETVQQDFSGLEQNVQTVQQDFAGLEQNVQTVEQDLANTATNVDTLTTELAQQDLEVTQFTTNQMQMDPTKYDFTPR